MTALNHADALMAGSSAVDKVYLGADVVWAGGPAPTWDFRTASALPPGWSRRGVTSETFDANGLTASVSAGQGYSYTHPDADANWTLEAAIMTASFASRMIGVMANLATGQGTAAAPYDSPSCVLVGSVNSSYEYGGTYTNGGGTPAYPMRLRLRKSANTFYCSMSTNDGASWTPEASLGNAGTYTTIGFGSILGTAATMTVAWVDFTVA